MAIIGIGTDIVEIPRIQAVLDRKGQRLAKRILHPNEWPQYQAQRHPARFLARRFAAKEAAAKALGSGFRLGIAFEHIEISHNPQGQPLLRLWQQARQRAAQLGITHAHLSLSDERHYACATVILEARALT